MSYVFYLHVYPSCRTISGQFDKTSSKTVAGKCIPLPRIFIIRFLYFLRKRVAIWSWIKFKPRRRTRPTVLPFSGAANV